MYVDSVNKQFGAWRLDDAAASCPVRFSIFFPDRQKDPGQYASQPKDSNGKDLNVPGYGDPKIQSIHVVGDFQADLGQPADWQINAANAMQCISHLKGWVWTYTTAQTLPAGFYEYKYAVTFKNGEERWVSDPCSRYGGSAVTQNSGFVVGPSPLPTTDPLPGTRKHLRDLVVYEVNIDDFTDEYRGARAALDAVCDKLDYLVKLGISAVLFMPWTAWADDNYGWGYTPYQYFSVEHRYTNDEADTSPEHETRQLSRLRNLINECHKRGIYVIMDGVFNHVGADLDPEGHGFAYRWLYEEADASPYVGIFGGTFGSLKDLDYHNGCTQEFIRDVCFYWMDEFKIDGIRFDNTTNFYVEDSSGNTDMRGLPTLLADIQAHAGDPNFSLTIEHLNVSAAAVTNKTAATSYWNDALYHDSFDYLWNGQVDPRIVREMDTGYWLKPGKVATGYLSNHDHSHVTWQCGARDNVGSLNWFRTQPYAIVLATAAGTPMIQNGQEFGEDHWIPENDKNSNRRVATRPLRWEFAGDWIGQALLGVYQKLLGIRSRYAGLHSDNFYPEQWELWKTQFDPQGYGIDVNRQVMIYHRWGNDGATLQRFMVVVNFSPCEQWVDVPFPSNGVWKDLLNEGVTPAVGNYWLRNWQVHSNWGNIFYREGE